MLFLEEIMNRDIKNKIRIGTIIDGEHMGAKGIYQNGVFYKSQGAEDVFQNVSRESIEAEVPSIEEVEGEIGRASCRERV